MALLTTAMCLTATASLPTQPANVNVTPPVQNLVATLTDFGTEDFYAGALEGSIYSANPSVRISTITHQIKPFAVAEGSYILAKAARRYPPGTVFVGEVDPGSAKGQRFIVLETLDGKLFVGPDNGLFTGVMDDLGLAHAYQITNKSLMNLEQESTTFRSFYISGPVAARLAGGVRPESVGPEIEDPVRLSTAQPSVNESMIMGAIILCRRLWQPADQYSRRLGQRGRNKSRKAPKNKARQPKLQCHFCRYLQRCGPRRVAGHE